jgi:hypothetical protein
MSVSVPASAGKLSAGRITASQRLPETVLGPLAGLAASALSSEDILEISLRPVTELMEAAADGVKAIGQSAP